MVADTGRGNEPSSTSTDAESRVIYIGQLPHGFYEEQLKGKYSMVLPSVANKPLCV